MSRSTSNSLSRLSLWLHGDDADERLNLQSSNVKSHEQVLDPIKPLEPEKKKLLRDTSVPKQYFYDHFCILRWKAVDRIHDPAQEFNFIREHDVDPSSIPEENCYVINTKWLFSWLKFVLHGGEQPGPVTNNQLIDANTGQFLENLEIRKHWRVVNKDIWFMFTREYGGGPTITIKSPPLPVQPESTAPQPKAEGKKSFDFITFLGNENDENKKNEETTNIPTQLDSSWLNDVILNRDAVLER